MKKRKYSSFQNKLNRMSKVPLTSDSDWCPDCGEYIETKYTSGSFPMPYREHKCKPLSCCNQPLKEDKVCSSCGERC
jgi:hypothetical protein